MELERRARNKISRYYPETGPYRRQLYRKHMAFFAGGGTHQPIPDACPSDCTGQPHRERACIAANRIGKTEGIGAYEVTLHATGNYPDWWPGRRFDRPIRAWAAGDTSKTVRESIQPKLYGPWGRPGTGMIPGDQIVHRTLRQGVSEALDTVYVKHASGGTSAIVLKSYDQRREGFQSSEVDLIWLDEEPDEGIYTEALMRTMTTGGLVLLTFTPLLGMSNVVLSYLEGVGEGRPKFCVQASWEDAPHLSREAREELWKSIPAYQRDARSKGIPVLGSGAIYQYPEDDYAVADFPIPKHWPRAFGLDVGWQRTAAIWAALNRDTDCLYLYSEHYRGEAEPAIHAQAINARGKWIRGAIDPSARGRNQTDGRQLLQMYRDLGLDLTEADNSVETGIYDVGMRLGSGRLKVFRSCQNLLGEMRLYRRDEKGRVVKERDHLCDATRYLVREMHNVLRTEPAPPKQETVFYSPGSQSTGWMG